VSSFTKIKRENKWKKKKLRDMGKDHRIETMFFIRKRKRKGKSKRLQRLERPLIERVKTQKRG